MTVVNALLGAAARQGRFILIAGLVMGLLAPALAAAFKPFIPHFVAALLFLAALRVGPNQALGAFRDLRQTLAILGLYQLALPLAFALVFHLAGWTGVLPAALILMAAAPPLAGSPALTILVGHDPAPALRLVVGGTLLLPLTILPVFALTPSLAGADMALAAALRLFAVIAGATAAGFTLHAAIRSLRPLGTGFYTAIDGSSAILLAIVVIGLMSAAGAVLDTDSRSFGWTLAAACIANFSLQLAAWFVLKYVRGVSGLQDGTAVPYAIIAGNRNVALFLAALPAAQTEPLMLFIGCYQIPMYLTPLLFRRLYKPLRIGREA